MFDGEKLKQLRKAKGLTQPQLAEKINYSAPRVGLWERGDYQPTPAAVEAICKFFGLTPVDFKAVPW